MTVIERLIERFPNDLIEFFNDTDRDIIKIRVNEKVVRVGYRNEDNEIELNNLSISEEDFIKLTNRIGFHIEEYRLVTEFFNKITWRK